MINWPCFIKYSDDDELMYVSDQSEWGSDVDLHGFAYEESDYMVDSLGIMYNLTKRQNKEIAPHPMGQSMTLEMMLGLIKGHAAQKGSCCVAKLYAPTISDAFKILESLSDV